MFTTLISKLKQLHMFYSTYVTWVLMGIAAWYLQLSVDQQQSIMAALPWLKVVGPLLGLVAFLVARGWPQPPHPIDPPPKTED